jgi:enamine deaminase RidA (YjgF/YER057c/UK114 family)
MGMLGRMTTDAGGEVPPGLYGGVPYEYAAVAPAGGVLFTAGACPLDRHGPVVAPGDHGSRPGSRWPTCWLSWPRTGAAPGDLVRTTIYVVGDRGDLVRVWDVVAGGLAPSRPPGTLLGVAVLGYPDQLVEIDGVASLPGATALGR